MCGGQVLIHLGAHKVELLALAQDLGCQAGLHGPTAAGRDQQEEVIAAEVQLLQVLVSWAAWRAGPRQVPQSRQVTVGVVRMRGALWSQ